MLADVSYCLDISKLVPVKTNLCREVMTLACVGSGEAVRIGRGYDSDVGQESLILVENRGRRYHCGWVKALLVDIIKSKKCISLWKNR